MPKDEAKKLKYGAKVTNPYWTDVNEDFDILTVDHVNSKDFPEDPIVFFKRVAFGIQVD